MIKKFVIFILVCCITVCCTSCKNGYDFTELEQSLSKDGETYHIDLADNEKDLYINRTYTLEANTKRDIPKLSAEEFEQWANGVWYLLCREQTEYEEAFKDKGDEFVVHITYQVYYEEKYIGDITEKGIQFTQADIKTEKSDEADNTESSLFQWQDDYILPTSSSEYLSYTDCENLNKEQLEMAINEILARHGVIFIDNNVQAYFESKEWYKGILPESETDESTMSELENRNIDALRDYMTMPDK